MSWYQLNILGGRAVDEYAKKEEDGKCRPGSILSCWAAPTVYIRRRKTMGHSQDKLKLSTDSLTQNSGDYVKVEVSAKRQEQSKICVRICDWLSHAIFSEL